MVRRDFIFCIIFPLWTIIQTCLHLAFAVYAYFMSICETMPTQAPTTFFYLTYLYNKKCPEPILQNYDELSSGSLETYIIVILKRVLVENNEITLEEIVAKLLTRLDFFPEQATASTKTSTYLLCYIILDGTWMISSVALLMGTCFGIKQTLSLIFYGPWLVMTIVILLFDASACIAFGIDVPETINFSSWLKFVGIEETSNFEDFDARNSSVFIPLALAPTMALCVISSKFIIIWLSNLLGLFYVFKATLFAYRDSYKNRLHRGHRSPAARSQADANTSADRIRNWQLFYGAVDTTTSTYSSKSERDISLNKDKDKESKVESARGSDSDLGNYFAYPDVADNINENGNVCLDELRGQLPWSYIRPQEEPRRRNSEEIIEMEGRSKRVVRLKSDSSISDTTEM